MKVVRIGALENYFTRGAPCPSPEGSGMGSRWARIAPTVPTPINPRRNSPRAHQAVTLHSLPMASSISSTKEETEAMWFEAGGWTRLASSGSWTHPP